VSPDLRRSGISRTGAEDRNVPSFRAVFRKAPSRFSRRKEAADDKNRLLHRVAPPGTAINPESIREIPLYDGDVEEEQGVPPAVQRLKDRIAEADGLLIVTPEYNASMPGVLKNAIDWLSRPAADISRVFRGRPVAIMGATPGPGGTALSQAAWLPVVRLLGMRPWFEGGVLISDADRLFDSDGRIVDEATRQRIRMFVEGFAVFVGVQQRQYDRVVPAALTSQLNLQLNDLMESGLRERGVTTIEAKESR
jgi:NAD(P)H-dependent FMN reductase